MRVSTSPEFLQSVMDHPQVRPWLVQDGMPAALSLAALWPQCFGLEFEDGGWVLHRLGDGVLEIHTLFLPGAKDVLAKCRAGMHFVFCGTDCVRLVTKVPADNIPADRLTRRAGFRLDYVREAAFLRGGARHDVKHYSLGLDDWLRDPARGPRWAREQCAALGQAEKGQRAAFRWAVMNDDYSVLEN